MDISRGLILKGTAATTAVATTSTGVYYNEEIGKFLSSVFSGKDAEENAQEGANQSESGDLEGQQRNEDQVAGVTDGQKLVNETIGKDSLGLPNDWEWPNQIANPTEKELTSEQLKKINFDGKTEGEDLTVNGEVILKIEKTDDENNFPEGFKFIFNPKNDNDVTITGSSSVSIALKKGMDLEFKIKITDNKWSLVRAWNKTTFAGKVNLTCSDSDDCSFETSGTTNIFVSSSSKLTDATITSGTGKVKLEEGQKGYNQGLKFTIEDADMNTSGTASASPGINKLEKYETYEIKEIEDGGSKKWFFARKNSAVQSINKKIKPLGLPTDCKFEEGESEKECGISDESKLKEVNFKGFGSGTALKVEGSVSGMKLKMERVSDSNRFPSDLKFTFKDFTADTITIKKENGGGNNNDVVLKKDTNPEFKLNSSGKLERAWTVDKLAEKVGLTCSASGSTKECSFNNGSIRIYGGDNKKITNASVSDASKKLEFTENEKDHNQGFKFTVKGNDDISLDPSNGISSLTKANASYEIKYIDDGWYLRKITAA